MAGEVFWKRVSSQMGYMRFSDLAKEIGVSKSRLSSWRTNKVVPGGVHTYKIAKVLKVTVEDLLRESEPVAVSL